MGAFFCGVEAVEAVEVVATGSTEATEVAEGGTSALDDIAAYYGDDVPPAGFYH